MQRTQRIIRIDYAVKIAGIVETCMAGLFTKLALSIMLSKYVFKGTMERGAGIKTNTIV
jgi:hypothetical protein